MQVTPGRRCGVRAAAARCSVRTWSGFAGFGDDAWGSARPHRAALDCRHDPVNGAVCMPAVDLFGGSEPVGMTTPPQFRVWRVDSSGKLVQVSLPVPVADEVMVDALARSQVTAEPVAVDGVPGVAVEVSILDPDDLDPYPMVLLHDKADEDPVAFVFPLVSEDDELRFFAASMVRMVAEEMYGILANRGDLAVLADGESAEMLVVTSSEAPSAQVLAVLPRVLAAAALL